MINDFKNIPGYHGDGDSSIELHHDEPVRWTKRSTVWAVATIVVCTVLAIAASVLTIGSN